jgi:WD40 repeat protein
LYIYELDSGSYFAAADHPPLLFFTGSYDKTVRIWDVATKQQVAELKGHTSEVTSVAFDSSGKYLASGEIA